MSQDRRKNSRTAEKKLEFNSNKISKIILVKKVALPAFVFVSGVLYLSYIAIAGSLELHNITKQKEEIVAKKENVEKNIIKFKKKNQLLKSKLDVKNPNIIRKVEVEPLVRKVINMLSLSEIINSAKVKVRKDTTYQNVVDIDIKTKFDHEYMDIKVVKNIIELVFNQLFYIKDVSIENKNIKFQIYKKAV